MLQSSLLTLVIASNWNLNGVYVCNIAAPIPSQTIVFQGSSCLAEPAVGVRADSSSVLRNSLTSTTLPSWGHSSVLPNNISQTRKGWWAPSIRGIFLNGLLYIENLVFKFELYPDDVGPSGPAVCCSSTESPPETWPSGDLADHANHGLSLQGELFYSVQKKLEESDLHIRKFCNLIFNVIKMWSFFHLIFPKGVFKSGFFILKEKSVADVHPNLGSLWLKQRWHQFI